MEQEQLSRSAAESAKRPSSSTVSADKPPVARAPVNPVPDPPAAESPAQPAPAAKKRRKQGPRGMARLFVNRPGKTVNGSAKRPLKSPSVAAKRSLPKHQETASESPKVGKLPGSPEIREQPMELAAAEQIIPSLSSPIWQPASKRVLDAVSVTDVTACSGVTITVRESSIIDGFFRSRPE